jgi:predicted O-methyltransferase YrrM
MNDAKTLPDIAFCDPIDFDSHLAEMMGEAGFYPMSSEPETGEFVCALVKLLRPRAVIELGTFRGFMTLQLIRAMRGRPGSNVVTVDCSDLRSPVLRRFDEHYTFVRGDDRVVVPRLKQEFGLAYIDTLHTREQTGAEIALVRANNPEAVLVLHDPLSHPGVAQAVEDFAADYDVLTLPTPPSINVGHVNGIAVMYPKPRAWNK